MRGGDHSYPYVQLPAYNITEDSLSQIFSTKLFEITAPILPVGQQSSAAS